MKLYDIIKEEVDKKSEDNFDIKITDDIEIVITKSEEINNEVV